MSTVAPSQTKPATQSLVIRPQFDQRVSAFGELFKSGSFRQSLSAMLPKSITPDRLIRVTLSAMTQNPEVMDCTPESIVLSLLRAAAMGLEPDGGQLGQGYLVPFNNKIKRNGQEVWVKTCQFIAGYRGLMKLARNSGEVADIWAEVVFESDRFEYELGLDQTLIHKRNDEVADPGKLKYVYAVARFRDGEKKFVVMNAREVEKIKAVSKSSDGKFSPWSQWPEEMWKKTAVRRLCKLLPLSIEAQEQVAADDDPSRIPGAALASTLTLDVPAPLVTHETELSVGETTEATEETNGHTVETDKPARGVSKFGDYLNSLADCLNEAECKLLYDARFGPESTDGWSADERQKAPQARDKRIEALKSR